MFSGIVEEMGVVTTFDRRRTGARLSIGAEATLDDLQPGDSVSVSGVCLTAVAIHAHAFAVDVSPETLKVTTIGSLTPGIPVNLERAMTLHTRLGGHLVAGHIDGVGLLLERVQAGDCILLTLEVPDASLRYCMQKGSITVDGVGLTINEVVEQRVSVSIIPHTAKMTTLGRKQRGDSVNVESDLIGKYIGNYVDQLLQPADQLLSKAALVSRR